MGSTSLLSPKSAVQIKMLIILIIPLLLAGCSTTSKRADFSTAEARIDMAIDAANPEAKKHLLVAKQQLKTAIDACNSSAEQLEEAVSEKNDAIKEAAYWKAKQRKALKELWFWRGALIVAVLFAARGPLLWAARKLVGIPW